MPAIKTRAKRTSPGGLTWVYDPARVRWTGPGSLEAIKCGAEWRLLQSHVEVGEAYRRPTAEQVIELADRLSVILSKGEGPDDTR